MKYDTVKKAKKKKQLKKCQACVWAWKQELHIFCPFTGCIEKCNNDK